MCLKRVTKQFGPNDDIIVGYKVVRKYLLGHKRKKQFAGYDYINEYSGDGFCLGDIKEAENRLGKPCSGLESIKGKYDFGFHVYTRRPNLTWYSFNYVVVLVHLWDIRAIGYDSDDDRVAVGKQIQYIQEIKT